MSISIQALPNTNQVDLNNLNVLSTRSRGQRFMVNDKGELRKLTGLFDRIYYFFFRGVEQAKVAKAIESSLLTIDLTTTSSVAFNTLFFKTLKPLSERVYDRSKLSSKLIVNLGGKSGELLKGGLAERVEKVRFAQKLGVEFQPVSEGHNGTYYGRDYLGNRLVVFKPYDEESSSLNCPKFISKIKGLFFKVFPFFRTHQNIKRECAYLNEIGASTVDQFMGLNIIPKTKLETFESERFVGEVEKKGSCQLYIDKAKMMQKAIGLPAFNHTAMLKRVLQKLWLIFFGSRDKVPFTVEDLKKLAIIEFVTGNQDGHTNNQLIRQKKMYGIDYGLAFPDSPPERYFSTINQYHFAHLPGANESFNHEDLALLGRLSDNEKELYDQLGVVMTDDTVSGFDESQMKAMKERIQILKAVISQEKSIEYLGKIKYACDFDRAKQELGLASSN